MTWQRLSATINNSFLDMKPVSVDWMSSSLLTLRHRWDSILLPCLKALRFTQKRDERSEYGHAHQMSWMPMLEIIPLRQLGLVVV